MKQRYGSLSLEVPDDFEDETVVILRAAPAPSATPLRMPRGEPMRATFVVKRAPLRTDPLPLESMALAEEQMLEMTLGATIHSREIRPIGGVDAIYMELSFAGPEGPVRQAHVSMVKDRWYLAFAATAPDDLAFNGVKERLLELVATAEISRSQ